MRLHYEEGMKRKDELGSELEEAQITVEKNRGVLLQNHELLKRNELKNKGLRERIIVMDKDLEASHRSMKAFEE